MQFLSLSEQLTRISQCLLVFTTTLHPPILEHSACILDILHASGTFWDILNEFWNILEHSGSSNDPILTVGCPLYSSKSKTREIEASPKSRVPKNIFQKSDRKKKILGSYYVRTGFPAIFMRIALQKCATGKLLLNFGSRVLYFGSLFTWICIRSPHNKPFGQKLYRVQS